MLNDINDHGLRCVRKISTEEITRWVSKLLGPNPEPFKPVAYYDKMVDTIRVITDNCLMMEVRVTPVLTLLERNRVEEGQAKYVGFCIETARIFCEDNGLPTSGTVKISEILKKLEGTVKKPNHKGAIREVAQAMLYEYQLDEVPFPES